MRLFLSWAAALAASAAVLGQRPAPPPVTTLKVPPGFHVEVFAQGVTAARELALGSKGTVFVGSMQGQNVWALVDSNGGPKAERVVSIGHSFRMPSGLAFHDGALYVADINRVLRYDNIESRLDNPPDPVVVTDKFPDDPMHGWKFIAFGPDGLLYVPVGAPCNICEPDARHAGIFRMKPDGTGLETFATGIRNSVGFDWSPVTKELWFTDNGRDNLGDDQPSDKLNRAPKKGMKFGYPYCDGGDVKDPDYGAKHPCSDFTPPVEKLGPHVASLGMRFYTGRMFPAEYHNAIFIAEHGSWNRSTPIGYRVVVVKFDRKGKPEAPEVFAEGWLKGIRRTFGQTTIGDAWGRPADVLVMPDGSLLVSDDTGNAVYRISYGGK
ncbi:MAG: PQQ-dependent sugar dehydrogenase [Vicinamibacterales bacterium]